MIFSGTIQHISVGLFFDLQVKSGMVVIRKILIEKR
jgi:hypothetical protein